MHFFGLGQDFPFEPPLAAWNYFCVDSWVEASWPPGINFRSSSRVESASKPEIILLESWVAPGSSGLSGHQSAEATSLGRLEPCITILGVRGWTLARPSSRSTISPHRLPKASRNVVWTPSLDHLKQNTSSNITGTSTSTISYHVCTKTMCCISTFDYCT